jgi:hypothetical protein
MAYNTTPIQLIERRSGDLIFRARPTTFRASKYTPMQLRNGGNRVAIRSHHARSNLPRRLSPSK